MLLLTEIVWSRNQLAPAGKKENLDQEVFTGVWVRPLLLAL